LSATGTHPERLIAVGGGSQSRVWLETLATILNKTIDIPISGDFGAAFGAARTGMIAVTGDPSIASAPQIATSIAPDDTHVETFSQAHARYTETYSALRTLS
ncbi:MAG: FGGY-family carbohydrate kinase, partial [Litoreibacter sp.]